jgi:hypothetical protein
VPTAKKGLYANLNAKRERIAHGSGEKMRSPGEPGAPAKGAFAKAAKTSEAAKKAHRSAAAKKAAQQTPARKTVTKKAAGKTPVKKAAAKKTARKTAG